MPWAAADSAPLRANGDPGQCNQRDDGQRQVQEKLGQISGLDHHQRHGDLASLGVGEGVGLVLLKRLDKARRDGDNILGVIKGMGASSDGLGSAGYLHYHADYNTGTNTIWSGPEHPSHLLLPVIPQDH